jgi:NADH-quinone oxidoreductase subunit D
LILHLDGETVTRADAEIGYSHRGLEKLAESLTYEQYVTVTDHLNCHSALNNNVGYAIAVEELLGITPPRRAEVARVILCEISRISDHILSVGLQARSLGARGLVSRAFGEREKLLCLIEAITGARIATSHTRIGGLSRDLTRDFPERVRALLSGLPTFLDDVQKLMVQERVFEDRLRDTGKVSPLDAIRWGLTGPALRACGVPYDVRKEHPYCGYERYDFDVPTHVHGDSWARLLQRMAEIGQSMRILEQALEDLPDGPYAAGAEDAHAREKAEPGREVYSSTETPNGELGFYILSGGEACPYRVRIRSPSFYHCACVPELLMGDTIADAAPTLSSLNIVAGELDR